MFPFVLAVNARGPGGPLCSGSELFGEARASPNEHRDRIGPGVALDLTSSKNHQKYLVPLKGHFFDIKT